MTTGRLVALAAAACLAGYVYAYTSGRAGAPIRSDAFSYYVYLPAWALHHDVSLQAVADDQNVTFALYGKKPGWSVNIFNTAGDSKRRRANGGAAAGQAPLPRSERRSRRRARRA